MEDPPLVAKIIRAVAEVQGVDPIDLQFSLHEHIETDALESLARHSGSSWTLSFDVPDHRVTVTSDGVVLVDGEES